MVFLAPAGHKVSGRMLCLRSRQQRAESLIARPCKQDLHQILAKPRLGAVPDRRLINRDYDWNPVQPHPVRIDTGLGNPKGVNGVVALEQCTVIQNTIHAVNIIEQNESMLLPSKIFQIWRWSALHRLNIGRSPAKQLARDLAKVDFPVCEPPLRSRNLYHNWSDPYCTDQGCKAATTSTRKGRVKVAKVASTWRCSASCCPARSCSLTASAVFKRPMKPVRTLHLGEAHPKAR